MDKKDIRLYVMNYENRSVRRTLDTDIDQTSCLPDQQGIPEQTVVFLDICKYTASDLRKKGIKAFHSPDTEIDDYSTRIEESIVLFSTDLIGQ